MPEPIWNRVFEDTYLHSVKNGKSIVDSRQHAEEAADEALDAIKANERGKSRMGFAPPRDRPAPGNLRITEGTSRIKTSNERNQ